MLAVAGETGKGAAVELLSDWYKREVKPLLSADRRQLHRRAD